MTDISKEAVDFYLLEKRGLYYRVGNAGYTGVKEEAERYTFDDVACMFPNMDSPNQDGITCIAENDAPEFSKACWPETKLHHREKQIKTLLARVEEAEKSAACWKQQVESHELCEEGRKQGLDEAKEAARVAVPVGLIPELQQWAEDELETCIKGTVHQKHLAEFYDNIAALRSLAGDE